MTLLLLLACAGPGEEPPGETAGDSAPDSGEDSGETADADGDGSPDDVDCDDADPAVFPGAPDACDEVDQDCDGVTYGPGSCGETLDVDAAAVHLTTDGHSAIVWPAGDLDGDGTPDLHAHEADEGGLAPDGTRQRAWLLYTRLADPPLDYPDGAHATFAQRPDTTEAETGVHFGDVDGDGHDDGGFPLAAPDPAVHLHFGPIGPGARWVDEGDAAWISTSATGNGEWGFPLIAGADLSGDGLADALVGRTTTSGHGEVELFLGGQWGGEVAVLRTMEVTLGDGCLLDDVDGDGVTDVFLGDTVHSVLSGADLAGADGATLEDLALTTFVVDDDPTWGAFAGNALAIGDWTGDGTPDLVLGAPHADVGAAEGGAAAWFSGALRGKAHPEDALGAVVGEAADALLRPAAALDVDGDGRREVIVEAAGEWVWMPASWGVPGPATAAEGLRTTAGGTIVEAPGLDADGDGDDDLPFNDHARGYYLGLLPGWAIPWDDPAAW